MHEARHSNEALLSSLSAALERESMMVADVITLLIEVEDRRLHLELACTSMFDFCTRRLGMSEGQTFRRLTAARLARTFPSILEAVRSRRLHLSSVALLRDLFTAENVDELIAAASGKSKSYVKDLVARLAPKPDAPSRIRQLPSPAARPFASPMLDLPAIADPSAGSPSASAARTSTEAARTPGHTARDDGMESPGNADAFVAAAATLPRKIAVADQVIPLSETRHKIQFTASSELRRKLERAQHLMRHRNIDGDLAAVVERALDLLVAKLENEKLGKTSRPRTPRANRDESTRRASQTAGGPTDRRVAVEPPRAVTAAVRREVFERDGERCTFTSSGGERCPARALIEIDHRHPRAHGGDDTPANLRLLCRAHNHYEAERVFGQDHIASAIERKRRKSAARTAARPEPRSSAHDSRPTASAATGMMQPSLPFV